MAFYGVYRGVVQDVSQLADKGRVRVMVPSVSTQGVWAPVTYSCSCAWGIMLGMAVTVAFEAGDPDRPIVLGQIDS